MNKRISHLILNFDIMELEFGLGVIGMNFGIFGF